MNLRSTWHAAVIILARVLWRGVPLRPLRFLPHGAANYRYSLTRIASSGLREAGPVPQGRPRVAIEGGLEHLELLLRVRI